MAIFLKEQGFQQQHQDTDGDGIPDKKDTFPRDHTNRGLGQKTSIEQMDDAHILSEAYKTYRNDGILTKKEIKTLEQLGTVLKEADIEVDRQTGDAKITQSNGVTLHVSFDPNRLPSALTKERN